MERTRRFPQRLIRWTSLCAFMSLVLPGLLLVPFRAGNGRTLVLTQGRSVSRNDKVRRVPPTPAQPGPPPGILPNLDSERSKVSGSVQVQPPINSTMRARRKRSQHPPQRASVREYRSKDLASRGAGPDPADSDRRSQQTRSHHARIGRSSVNEALTTPPQAGSINVALASNGATASTSSTYGSQTPAYAINGDRKGLSYGWWTDNTSYGYPDWIEVAFSGSQTINEIDVIGLQENWTNPVDPTLQMTAHYALTSFVVQYWNGSAWTTVPGGSVTGNDRVWKKFTFAALTTNKIRIQVANVSGDNHTQVVELEAWTATGDPNPEFAMARLAPGNRTGTDGEDLLSNNFNWNLPLVGLKGRGLDLGLTLSYNSLVWTRAGNSIDFDVDEGSIAPGFRLGFATVEGPFPNDQAGTYFYLLVTPSGARVELRYTGTGNVYESKDSSHLQLVVNSNSLLVRPTDGTQMNFVLVNSMWRCNQIKDRNGNYLTVTYRTWGEIDTVKDTLGRLLTFNYDSNENLVSITQTWSGQTHQWATFGWSTASIGNNFPALTNLGPTSVPVLTQVGLPDGSFYNFEYSNSYGMVSKIKYSAADQHLRRYTTYVAAESSTDCPRLIERRDWAEEWNGDNDHSPAAEEEAVTAYAHDGDGGCRVTLPDNTVHKEFYGSGWQSGLTMETRSYPTVAAANSNSWQKKTTVVWTQDNTGVAYLTNPRVTETNIYDAQNNRRRQTIDYGSYASWSLPHLVKEYAANGTTELRRSQTDYQLAQAYLDRRVIGLPSLTTVFDSVSSAYVSKTTYEYDWGDEYFVSPQPDGVQHDTANYGSGFLTGRGNLSSVTRWDVTDINNSAKAVTQTRVAYNSLGAVYFARDALGHQTTLSYVDSFSDNVNRNTYAYPTSVKDADNFQSFFKYNYDFGAVTRTQGPPPAEQSQGVIQAMLYDSAGRLERLTTENNGAYTRWVYDPYSYVSRFDTIQAGAGERYTITVWDGGGRVRGEGGNHSGSTGGYWGKIKVYDVMGSISQQTNATEVNGGWLPVGDDAAGWVSSYQTYDWKGRPLLTTHQDGSQAYASYSGCGCAGGEIVTHTDEMGRQRKVYSDILGRQWKTEVMNGSAVYSTTVSVFNAADQVISVRQYVGAAPSSASSTNESAECPSNTCQETVTSFDGYGRLKTRHAPQQQVDPNNSASTDHTTWEYNSDDTIHKVTDARGATETYSCNDRHLITGITYDAPSGITPAASVSFGYDAVGNRTSMTDGLGSVNYHYDQLSRMDWEERVLTNLGTYRLSYEYALSGQLKSITDPFNATINYSYDASARVSSVTGTSFGGVTTYASNSQYRAWGALKSLTYGNSKTLSINYNNRLRASSYELPGVMKKSYQRNEDGSVQFTQDQLTTNSKFDRLYTYDHVGRVETALTGQEARGGGSSNDRPYSEVLTYDAMGHFTSLERLHWDRADGFGPQAFVNNRVSGWVYDADGRLTSGSTGYFTYNAAGQPISFGDNDPYKTDQMFDGDGRRVKTIARRWDEPTEQFVTEKVRYCVTSSVLGGALVSELSEQGAKERTSVFVGGSVLASQKVLDGTQSVEWQHYDASGASYRATNQSGQSVDAKEVDPLGANAGLIKPATWNVPDKQGLIVPYPELADMILHPGGACEADGMPIPCEMLTMSNSQGCPNGNCGPQVVPDKYGNPTLAPLTPNPNTGALGYWPDGFNSSGRLYDSMGHLRTVSAWTPGHQTLEWGWMEVDGELIYTQISTSYSGSEYFEVQPQNRLPTGRPSQTKPGCVFDVSITTNDVFGRDDRVGQAMKDEIVRIYADAGQEINFVHTDQTYALNIVAKADGYTKSSDAVGNTPTRDNYVMDGGRVFIDRLTESASKGNQTFKQNSLNLAIGAGRAGSHEIGHYLLQQNFHSSSGGVMRRGFAGEDWFARSTAKLWFFTDDEKKQLNKLCGR